MIKKARLKRGGGKIKKTPIIKKKKKVPKRDTKISRAFLVIFLWFSYLCFGFYLIFYSGILDLSKIEIIDIKDDEKKGIIENIFNEKIQGENKVKIKNKNLLVFKSNDFSNELSSLPFVQDVKIKKVFPNKIVVNIKEYGVILLVCDKDVSSFCTVVNSDTGKPDEKLTINDELKKYNDILYIVLNDENLLERINKRETIIPIDIMDNIKYFYNNITYSIDAHVPDIYKAETIGFYDFFLKTDENWELRVDFTQDMKKVLSRLRRFFNNTDIVENRDDIIFIDTRFDKRIIYKLKSFVDKKESSEKIEE